MDISQTIVAKSDQLNADDLVGGPVTVKILAVSRGGPDQPVDVKIDGGHKLWRPCKTTRRVLAFAWGTESDVWVGRSLTLFRDPTVKWAGEAIGGIRISAMSHIPSAMTMKLAETKGGKKLEHKVAVLTVAEPPPPVVGFLGKLESEHGIAAPRARQFFAAQHIDIDRADRATLGALYKRMAPGGDLRTIIDTPVKPWDEQETGGDAHPSVAFFADASKLLDQPAETINGFLHDQGIDPSAMDRKALGEVYKRLDVGGDLRAMFDAGPADGAK